MKNITEMTNDELLAEMEAQSEYLADDSFEFTVFSRGDNGMRRMDYIAKLREEAVGRGLCEPLPPSGTDDDPDFDDIKAYMESRGFVWFRSAFRKFGNDRHQTDYVPFSDAAQQWHECYVEDARRINRTEMWGGR